MYIVLSLHMYHTTGVFLKFPFLIIIHVICSLEICFCLTICTIDFLRRVDWIHVHVYMYKLYWLGYVHMYIVSLNWSQIDYNFCNEIAILTIFMEHCQLVFKLDINTVSMIDSKLVFARRANLRNIYKTRNKLRRLVNSKFQISVNFYTVYCGTFVRVTTTRGDKTDFNVLLNNDCI